MGKLGNVGVGASMVCAVHCAVLPLLVGFSAGTGSHGANGWVDAALLFTAAAIGYLTLGAGFREHGRPLPLVLLTAGLIVLVAAHQLVPMSLAAAAAFAGASLLVAAQVANRRCPSPCCPDKL